MHRWIDLFDPDEDQKSHTSRIIHSEIPNRINLETIDRTSKFDIKNGNIYLSIPMLIADERSFAILPLGIILSDDYCVTIRYIDCEAIDNSRKMISKSMTRNEVFFSIVDRFIEKLYDNIDILDQKMTTISQEIFNYDIDIKNSEPRTIIKKLGRLNDYYSSVKKSCDGFLRALDYLSHCQIFSLDDDTDFNEIDYMSENLSSINDSCNDMLDKITFLLSSILGFVNIDQTNSARILAMVSTTVAIPTLIAGVYGMNFDYMPELRYHNGYFITLGSIFFMVGIFIIYFWKNNWFKNL